MNNYAKGRRYEEALVRLLCGLGVTATRVPLSGGGRHTRGGADIIISPSGKTVSVKTGRGVPDRCWREASTGGMIALDLITLTVFTSAIPVAYFRKSIGACDYLAVKKPRRHWLIIREADKEEKMQASTFSFPPPFQEAEKGGLV